MSKPSKKYLPILMWAVAAGFYFYELFLQVSPSVMAKSLMDDFAINAAQLGFMAALYFYAFSLLQIPVGVLLDRFGARRLLTCAALICAVGALLFGVADSFLVAACARFLIGFGSAFATISCMYIASLWLPLEWFSLLTGLMLTIGMTGAICGQAPLALLVSKVHWRITMYILGGIGLVVAALIWSIVRDRSNNSNHLSTAEAETKLLTGLKTISRNRQLWLCAIFSGLFYTPTLVLGTLWGVPFIIAKYHLSKPVAASVISAIYFGWVIGAPCFGWLSDRFKKRKFFMAVGCCGALLAILVAIFLPPSLDYYYDSIAIFAIGFFSSSLIISYSVARETCPASATGAAMGIMNAVNMLGGALIPPIVGIILDKLTLGVAAKAAHSYSLHSYTMALVVLPALLLAAILLLLVIKEPKFDVIN